MQTLTCRAAVVLVVAVLGLAPDGKADNLTHVQPDERTGTSRAIVVPNSALVHTSQLLPLDGRGNLAGKDAAKQVEQVLDNLGTALAGCKSDLEALVKLNVTVARPEVVDVLHKAMAGRFPAKARPAIGFVAGKLPHPDALLALDAVAQTPMKTDGGVRLLPLNDLKGQPGGASAAILPPGGRIYVAGQAEPGDLATATRKTLDSLEKTLTFLRRKKTDVVQVKAFLMPMSEAGVVEKMVEEFFGKGRTPPLVLVEWQSSPKTPIEIELVAWNGPEYPSAPDVIDYLTPPGMTASKIYSRVSRIRYGPSIYVSGLCARKEGGAKDEVEDVFAQLKDVLAKTDSDLKHLAKATYYVSTEAVSKALNELRPNYYDPQRPPAASKAMVSGTGRAGRTLTLDMIAVPTMKVPATPPEVGHGLTPKMAAEGWIALFDGRTTFGWKDAKVEDGILVGGTTTSTLGPCALRAEVVAGGLLKLGNTTLNVRAGRRYEVFDTGSTGPVELLQGARLKSLVVRPLGLKSIFNGRDLDGWKRIDRATIPEDRRPVWKVEKGVIVATGGPGAIEYTGGKFGDLVLQIDVRTRSRHANGGVFFRAIPGDFMNGYEAQVYNRCADGDPAKPAVWATGGIDDRQNARRLVSRDFETYRMTLIARGPHLATWINGYQVTDWTDTRAADANPRKGLRVEPGVIQLQAHDPLTDVEYRSIQVGD